MDCMEPVLPLHPKVELLGFHACGLVALNKPVGVRAHPNTANTTDSAALILLPYDSERECYHAPKGTDGFTKIYLLNRLDAATSGVILVALNGHCARTVRALFAEQSVKKTYLALVKGKPAGVPPVWKDYLTRTQGRGGKVKVHEVASAAAGQVAKTHIGCLGSDFAH